MATQKPFTAETSVITCDMQGTVTQYAADAADLFGWSPTEVIGKMSVAAFHHSDGAACCLMPSSNAFRTSGFFHSMMAWVRSF